MLLNEKENEAALQFARSHFDNKCHRTNVYEAIELTAKQTGMGFTILTKCPWCREEKNITDHDVW